MAISEATRSILEKRRNKNISEKDSTLPGLSATEIGRASCRERV